MSTTARRRASIWSYRSLIWNFTQRDLKSRFKGTALGWVWSLVVPVATLFTYSLVFSVIFRAEPPPFGNGNPGFFPVWLFCGLVAWTFFLVSVNTAIPTLLANGPTLQKVYFPSYVPVLGSVAGILVQTLIECAILAASLLFFQNVGPTWLLFPFWLCLFVVFVACVALSLSIMNVYYRDLAHLTNVALQLLFFLTPIIYEAESVPESWYGIPLRAIVLLNPIAVFVETFRALAYDLQAPSLGAWLVLGAWASGAVVVAIFVYSRRGLDIAEAI